MTISVREVVCSSDYKRIDRIIPLLHLKGDLTTKLSGFYIFYANRQKLGYEKGWMCSIGEKRKIGAHSITYYIYMGGCIIYST